MATLLSTSRITRIQARIDAYELDLAAMESSFLTVSGRTLKEYRFDSGEGMQRGELQDISALIKGIRFLEARIEHLYAKLAGRGLTNLVLRRL